MALTLGRGTIYMVVRNDDLTGHAECVPNYELRFAPRRRTLRWRGKRFNIPTVRLVAIGAADLSGVNVTALPEGDRL